MLAAENCHQGAGVEAGVAVSVLRRSQSSGLSLRLDGSNTKRHPNTSMYTNIE